MISTTTEDGLEAWGHPTRITPELRALWSRMSDRWNQFAGDIPSPSMDLGAGISKGRTVSVDPFPRGHVDIRALGENLPFRSRTFASVVLESVLKHVLSPTNTLAETRRVTANDGWLFITSPVNHIDSHRHSFSTEELCKLIESAGYRIVRRMGLGFSSTRLDRMWKRLPFGIYTKIRIPIRICRTIFIVTRTTEMAG